MIRRNFCRRNADTRCAAMQKDSTGRTFLPTCRVLRGREWWSQWRHTVCGQRDHFERLLFFFILFKEYCRQFFTILAGEGYIRFLTQRSKLEEVGACTQSEGSEFQSSMVLTKKEYLNVLFLGAYGLTVFE